MREASSTVRLALAFGAAALLFVLSAPASAQLLDPVTETVEDPIKKAKRYVEKTVDQVDETVEETTEPVVETVEETTQKVDEKVHEVTETVNGVVDETIQQPQEEKPVKPGPADGNTDPGVSDPGAPKQPGPQVEGTFHGEGRERTDPNTLQPQLPVAAIKLAPAAAVAGGPPPLASSPTSPRDAAQRLAFPLFMIAAVVAFLVVQGHFDRRDPKLLFDVDPGTDALSFE